jgi:putative flavoprotein involved in K+ transport
MPMKTEQQRNAHNHVTKPKRERIDVAVIGAGQAGLSISYYLTEQGRDHVVLERASRLAEPWRSERWDSFTLVTPNWTLQLPGFPYRGDDPDGYESRAGVVRYFEDYAASFQPPIRFGTEATAVEADPSGNGFIVTSRKGQLRADNVVVANGSFQRPRLPAAAEGLPASILQLHSSQYRNPDALPPGAVLVVGTAQSGSQIAEELYKAGREVYLSVGSAGRAPRRYRGKDCVWWLVQLGFFDQPFDSMSEQEARHFSPPHVTGNGGGRTLNLHQFARDGVHLLGQVQGANDGNLMLAPDLHENLEKADGFAMHVTQMIDGFVAKTGMDAPQAEAEPPLRDGYDIEPRTRLDLAVENISTIIWATGYQFDYSWVRFPIFDRDGYPIQRRGVTEAPGLYFLGQEWLHTRKSGTILGVGDDAAHIATAIAARAGVASTMR